MKLAEDRMKGTFYFISILELSNEEQVLYT